VFDPRRYEVTGTQPVSVDGIDHEPGDVFEADLLPEQEARMLARGSLRLLPQEAKETPPPLDTDPPKDLPTGWGSDPTQPIPIEEE